MKKPMVGQPYSFRMEDVEFSGIVMQLYRDPECRPYGVIVELLSEQRPKRGAQCWVEGIDGSRLGGSIEEIWEQQSAYKARLVTIFPYKDFWDKLG